MTTAAIMRMTLAALLPGAMAYAWYFGAGVVLNLLITIVTAVLIEAAILKVRQMPLSHLGDGTVIVTAVLLGLCLPPLLPAWQVILGTGFAVVFGKHVYGGLGQNVFNPAMVGFAVLIVSFPLSMSQWPEPETGDSLSKVVTAKLNMDAGRAAWDGMTAATPLDSFKFRAGLTSDEHFNEIENRNWIAWAWINLGFLAGGLYLLYRRIIPWQTPATMLATIALLAVVFYDGGSSISLGSPAFHLFTGATMLAAFFVITDPVTAPSCSQGLLLYGAGIGLITFIIRSTGAYPEGIAFAVLLMNASAPLMDHLMSPREQAA